MLNWYAMGANAPSCIDAARARAYAANVGDVYEEREARAEKNALGLSRSGSIRVWRAEPVTKH